ncbi:MAG: hypothetical protein R2911_28540 [Caldilineaceae bacterium]
MLTYRPFRIALLTICLGLMLHMNQPLHASEPCNPPNVIPREVCDFDSFYGSPPRQLPNGWTEFIFYGDPTFMQDKDTFWGVPVCASGAWAAPLVGIYTQVG